MKRFFQSLLIFIPVSVFCYLLGVIIWGFFMPMILNKNLVFPYQGYGNMYTRLKEVKQYRDVNYLFVGSSHAYRGFDTRYFNNGSKSSFNLGSNSQTPIQSEWLINRYIDQLNPDTVVIEVYPGVFEMDGTESSLDILANERFSKHSFNLAFNTLNIKVLNALILSGFKSLLYPEIQSNEEVKSRPEGVYIKGGYVELSDSTYRNVENSGVKRWDIKEKQVKAFERLIKKVNERGIPYLLVQAPITKSLYHSYTNNGHFDQLMYRYGHYINFNGQLPLNDSIHFYDNNHLNKQGVKIFNEALLARLHQGISQ